MERLETINQRLSDIYGKSEFENKPFYKVCWAADEREIITDVFIGHTKAGLCVGTQVRTEEVRKYPDYDNYWVLEYIQPNTRNHELRAKFSYEPIWIFRDPDDNPLPFDWEVIEKVIHFHKTGMAKTPKTEKMHAHEEEEKVEKEKAEILDNLQHDEAFPNKLYDSDVVSVPHKEFNSDVYEVK